MKKKAIILLLFTMAGIIFGVVSATAKESFVTHDVTENAIRQSTIDFGVVHSIPLNANDVTWNRAAIDTADIKTAGETVYFSFVPVCHGNYDFQSETEGDTYGVLLDKEGLLLSQDDNSGEGNNFRISSQFLRSNETYYYGVRWKGSSTGLIKVSLSRSYPVTALRAEDAAQPGGATSDSTLRKGAYASYSFPPSKSGTYVFQSLENENNPILWLENSQHKAIASTDGREKNSDSELVEPIFIGGSLGLGLEPIYGDSDTDVLLRYSLTAGETYYYGLQWSDADIEGTVSVRLRRQFFVSYKNSKAGIVQPDKGVYNGEPYGDLYEGSAWNYIFNGWYTEDGERITKYSIVNLTENQNLYGHWLSSTNVPTTQYSIIYHENHGTWSSESEWGRTAKKRHDQSYVIDPPAVSRTGHAISGWSISENGAIKYQAGDIYDENENLDLYAIWEPLPYTISFHSNGGSPVTSVTRHYGETVGELPKSEKEDFHFIGWYAEPELKTLVTNDSILNLSYETETVTLYANWENWIVASGICKEDVTWKLDKDGVLTLKGKYRLIPGDVNGDAKIDESDSDLVSKALVGLLELTLNLNALRPI